MHDFLSLLSLPYFLGGLVVVVEIAVVAVVVVDVVKVNGIMSKFYTM